MISRWSPDPFPADRLVPTMTARGAGVKPWCILNFRLTREPREAERMFEGVNAVDVLTAAGVLWLTVRMERVAGRVDALETTVQTVLSALVRRPDRAA